MSDVGLRVISFLLKQMQPDEKWLEKTKNGFRWAYSKFGQEVTVEEARHPDAPEQIADIVNISSMMLKDVEDTIENRRIINDYIGYNTSMCTPVFNEKQGELFLNVRVAVQNDIVNWMEKLLSVCMVIQQHEVLKNAEQLADLTHSEPAYYSHPKSGIREDTDEILKVYDDLIVPFGWLPGKCSPEEIDTIASTKLQSYPFVVTTHSDSGITTELPQGTQTSLLEFNTMEPHPDYGFGLNVKHSFFYVKDERKGLALAMYHNKQLSIALRSYGFGSFVYRNGFLVYRLFMPNFVYERGMLWNLCLSAIIKAQGMTRFLKLPPWDKNSVRICLETRTKELLKMKDTKT